MGVAARLQPAPIAISQEKKASFFVDFSWSSGQTLLAFLQLRRAEPRIPCGAWPHLTRAQASQTGHSGRESLVKESIHAFCEEGCECLCGGGGSHRASLISLPAGACATATKTAEHPQPSELGQPVRDGARQEQTRCDRSETRGLQSSGRWTAAADRFFFQRSGAAHNPG